MLALLLVLLIVCIFILSWVAIRSRECHKRLVEAFRAEDEFMRHDISEDDKYLYFMIIDLYQKNLNRDPDEDELYAHFDQIRGREKPLSVVYQDILSSDEYERLHTDQGTEGSLYSTKQNIHDYDAVYETVMETMPEQQGTFFEKNNQMSYVTFLVAKYRELGRDKVALREYILRTPEYAEYTEKRSGTISSEERERRDEEHAMRILKREVPSMYQQARASPRLRRELTRMYVESSRSKDHFVAKMRDHPANKADGESGSTVSTQSSVYVINRPHTRKSSSMRLGHTAGVEEEHHAGSVEASSSCEFFKKAQYLNNVRNRRNLDEQKYMCEISKAYDNVSKDMTLAEGHEWNVPQKRTPVCHTEASCDVHASRDQTALLGTVLDATNDRILPSFEYKENV